MREPDASEPDASEQAPRSAQTSGDFYVAARFGHTRSHDLHARRTHDWTAPTKEATENIQARVAQWQSIGLVNRRF